MNIQPIGINQNRQQNFGMDVNWNVCKGVDLKPTILQDSILSMKKSVTTVLAWLPVEQKAKLVKLMEALEGVPVKLEFDRPIPDNDCFIKVRTINNNHSGINFDITPRLLEDSHNAEGYGESLVSAIEKLLPSGTTISPESSIKEGNGGELFNRLLKAFKITD